MTWRDQFVHLPGQEKVSLQEKLVGERTQTVYIVARADESLAAVYYFDAAGNLASFSFGIGFEDQP